MISIDDQYVTAAASSVEAAKNGRALVLKKKFEGLGISRDGKLLFGKCQGSGKTPYACSCDFLQPELPVYRCNCPSRQFPCKHCVGLMYAYVEDAAAFVAAEVPEELQAKRVKAQARAETKKSDTKSSKPKRVNKAALAKKIQAQLDGLDLLERLTHHLIDIGIGNMNVKLAREIESQARQLGDAYLLGAQSALRAYTSLFSAEDGRFDGEMSSSAREAVYSEALDKLSTLNALVKQGRAYLQARLSDPDLKPETESNIAAWLGHAWQLAELREAGLVERDAELLQLAFHTHDDVARKEWVDTGIWVNLATGLVYTTKNYRPYKAAKFIKAEDSFFQVACVPELLIYPGDMNQRIRWEGMTARPIKPQDLEAIRRAAHADFSVLVKQVKGNLKGPLSEKYPVCLLKFHRIGEIDPLLVIEDAAGNRLTMTDRGIAEEPASLHLLHLVPADTLRDQVLVARFRHDLDSRRLQIKPLAIVTNTEVVRLTL
jgi:hypothetical protein